MYTITAAHVAAAFESSGWIMLTGDKVFAGNEAKRGFRTFYLKADEAFDPDMVAKTVAGNNGDYAKAAQGLTEWANF